MKFIFKKQVIATTIIACFLSATTVNANDIIYDVSLTGQNGDTVTGTITTDGTLGVIQNGNITGWNITLTAGASETQWTSLVYNLYSNNISNDSFVNINQTQLIATNTYLEFLNDNTVDVNSYSYASLGFFNHNEGIAYFELYSGETSYSTTGSILSQNLPEINIGTDYMSHTFLTPTPLVPTIIGNVSAVPLPAAVWLFGSILAGFVGFNRRKSA